MKLLPVLLIAVLAGLFTLIGILPPSQMQAWLEPAGTVLLYVVAAAVALCIWHSARRFIGRVTTEMREPDRYGVPLPEHQESSEQLRMPEHQRRGLGGHRQR